MSTYTLKDHREVFEHCKNIFLQKNQDYGTSWRVLTPPTFTDQLMIKAKRIRTLQGEKDPKLVEEIDTELVGIINYSIMALMQIRLPKDASLHLSIETLTKHYNACMLEICNLVEKKNRDYQDAWRTMRASSMVEIILMKLLRIRKIEDNEGETLISEGVEAGYQDIINYAIFVLIQSSSCRATNS